MFTLLVKKRVCLDGPSEETVYMYTEAPRNSRCGAIKIPNFWKAALSNIGLNFAVLHWLLATYLFPNRTSNKEQTNIEALNDDCNFFTDFKTMSISLKSIF